MGGAGVGGGVGEIGGIGGRSGAVDGHADRFVASYRFGRGAFNCRGVPPETAPPDAVGEGP